MPATIDIKPARKKLIVRDPLTKQVLSAEGKTVTDNTYWRRRFRDGDILINKKSFAEVEAEKKASATKKIAANTNKAATTQTN